MDDLEIPLAQLVAEEEELQFTSFTNDDAWTVGSALVTAARRVQAPVAIVVADSVCRADVGDPTRLEQWNQPSQMLARNCHRTRDRYR